MSTGEILVNVLFYVMALAALGGAAVVALSKNIVRSAFALLAVLFGAAAFYAFMRADFLFAAQILIYVGGILVLIVFAIMLTHRITDVKLSNDSRHGPAAFFACLCVLFSIVVVVVTHRWSREVPPVRKVVSAAPATLNLGMLQGDGSTGIPKEGLMMDGRGFLTVEAREMPAAWDAATFVLERRAESGWVPSGKGMPVRFETSRAKLEVKDLEPGAYRWFVELPGGHRVAFGDTEKPDFRVERGLTRPIAAALMGPYLLPFEIISVLLLAALIGAAFLARKEVRA